MGKTNDYIVSQIRNVEEAIRIAEKARRTTDAIQDYYSPQETADSEQADAKKAFYRDAFKYFDANDAIRQLESLQLQLGDLKNKLIEIKIANDRLLFAGGYLAFIDEYISRIFLKNTLCKLQAQNEKTPVIIEDSIQELQGLKARLEEMNSKTA